MRNYIRQIIKSLDAHHGRLGELKGALFHINSIFQKHEKEMQAYLNTPQKRNGQNLIWTHLGISDLTGEIVNGGVKVQNINSTYLINADNFNNEMRLMLYRQAGYTIAQSYESFFRFIKDCALFTLTEDETLIRLVTDKLPEKKHEIAVTKFKNRTAKNSAYLEFVAKAYPTFGDFLITNRRKIDYIKYLDVLEFVRDKFAHSLGIFNQSESQYKKLIGDLVRKKIANGYFPMKLNGLDAEFTIDFKITESHLSLIAEISFQLYKLICIERQMNWERHYNPTTKQHEYY